MPNSTALRRCSGTLSGVITTLILVCTFLMLVCALAAGQTGETATPQQAPHTAPQVQQVLPSYEGQHVTSVELAGRPDLDTNALTPLLAQKAGEPFSQAKVDTSVAALQRTGKFQTVELEVRPEADGVRVLLVLQPAIYFGVYEFPGAVSHFAYSRLLQVANYPPRGAYTPVDVENAQRALETFFRRSGYFLAKVEPQIQTDKVHGLANVIFNVTLNRRAKFGKVTITGPTPQETARLRQVLHSWMARFRGSAIRQGKTYSPKKLQNATQYLENTLMKQSHLGAQVRLVGAAYDPETNRADVEFHVNPGPLVKVKVDGAHIWSWDKRKLLPLYQQAGFNPELIQEGRQNLISYFQSKGFFDVKVAANVQQQPSEDTVLYEVTKGPRHKVAEVSIAGNQHLSTKQLMPHVEVQEGHFLLSRGKYSEKLVRGSVNNLKRMYQAEGFSDVKITPQVTNRNGNIAVRFQVDEGQRDIVEALKIQGNNTQPESQIAGPAGLKVTPGQPYSQKLVDDDRNHIMANYLNQGYLNATFRATAQPVSGDNHRLQVVYQIYEGPRVTTATVVTLGRKTTRPTLIDRTAEIQSGHPMREEGLLSAGSRLYNLGVFDWAEVDPRRQITTQTKEDAVVKVHEAKRNTITYGFGFEVINRGGSLPSGTIAVPGLPPVGVSATKFKTSEQTFWGPRGSFEYTRKNVRGKAEAITVAGLAGRLDQRGSLTFSDPHFRGTNWIANYTTSGEHDSENPIFTSRLADAGFELQHALNPDKTRNFFVRYRFRETGLTHLLIPDLVPPEDRHVRLSTLASTYIRDTRDNSLDAHKGFYETAEIDFNPKALGSNFYFARFLGQTAYYKNIGGGVIWANSIRLGLDKAFAGSHVPVSEKFFSGGGSTIRGFPLNGAGPQHTIQACGTPQLQPCPPSDIVLLNVPDGGNQLFIVNSEFRIPIPIDFPLIGKNLGLVTFYDGGNVFPTIGFHGQYTNTFGGGIRYSTPIGPIRVDIGHNLNAPPGIKRTQLFITLGQAF